MNYICSVCKQQIHDDLILFKDHTERHIIDLIKHDHPDWVESDGVCKKCADFYRAEITGSIFKDVPCAMRNRKIKSFWQKLKGIFFPGSTT